MGALPCRFDLIMERASSFEDLVSCPAFWARSQELGKVKWIPRALSRRLPTKGPVAAVLAIRSLSHWILLRGESNK